jgi:Low affinity iron permease
LVAAMEGASNRLVHAEQLSEQELDVLDAHYATLASMAKSDRRLTQSHSIEEARRRHGRKAEVTPK